jgi:hypothetical protein
LNDGHEQDGREAIEPQLHHRIPARVHAGRGKDSAKDHRIHLLLPEPLGAFAVSFKRRQADIPQLDIIELAQVCSCTRSAAPQSEQGGEPGRIKQSANVRICYIECSHALLINSKICTENGFFDTP